jgi:predicted  nucleic acid-binding Zn-ribbon protein
MAKTKVLTVEERLTNLYKLQHIASQLDEINTLKGELPMEVSDLEDEIEGLKRRIQKMVDSLKEMEDEITVHKGNIKESNLLIEKYKNQLDNVKNNREFEALTKELEYQSLEIQLSEKKIREAEKKMEAKNELIDEANKRLELKQKDLEHKKVELEEIIEKTESKEDALVKKFEKSEKLVEDRLIKAFKKIRTRSKNGLAVVTIVRGTCGGCYNAVPPQIQIEIAQKKEIIACENCGRVIVADDIATSVDKIDRTVSEEEVARARYTSRSTVEYDD